MRGKSNGAIAASLATLALLGACGGKGGEGADCPAGVKQKTPSGYCVPRYLSLKRGEVFGRKGPGKDYATVYVYHARGLPVQVVDETSDWRRICDPAPSPISAAARATGARSPPTARAAG